MARLRRLLQALAWDRRPEPAAPARRAAARWRVLVHERDADGTYGASHPITPDPAEIRPRGQWLEPHLLAGCEFDELVLGRTLHIEEMDEGQFWMSLAGITIDFTMDADGRPTHVLVQGPGDNDDPVEGCAYELVWSRGDGDA